MLFLSVGAFFSLLLTAWALPVIEERAKGTFEFFELPTALAGPCDLAAGPDGALWGESILLNEIFRVDPKTGKVEEYKIPTTTPFSNATIPGIPKEAQDRGAFSCAIRPGADGNMYATNGVRNQLVRINPTSKKIDIFEPQPVDPLGNLFPFNDLYTDAGGLYITQTTGNIFQYFSFKDESWTTYRVPTPAAFPLGVFVASDGLVYITEFAGNNILVFNPTTKAINEYGMPEPAVTPGVVRAEKDGWVYFTISTGNGMGRINMTTHKVELYHTNQVGGLGAVNTRASDGGIWMSFFTIDALARFDPDTLKFTYLPFPDTFASFGVNGIAGDVPPYVDISVNYGPGDYLWFASFLKNAVGRYSLS